MVPLEIVLKLEEHQELAKIAKRDGRSLSDLVREIVVQQLAERDRGVQTRREIQAIEELTHIRKQQQAEHGRYQGDLLGELREEREQDMERIWGDEA